ncbi:MAG: hypothetical protein ACM3P1_00330 [Candidatus Saccharibacteria bacterium]
MYKLYLILFLSLSGMRTLNAQDLVVTSRADSINCTITKMDAVNIYFTFKQENVIHKTMMPFQMIRTYRFNYYPGTVIAEPEKLTNPDFPHWRIGLNGGISRQTATLALEVPYEMVDYAESLQSGINLNGDVFYYFSENIGVGAKYVAFGSTADKISNSNLDNFNLNVRFYGPALSGRLMNQTKKNAFFFNAAIGKVDYKILMPMIRLTGNTLSSMFEVGYDVRIYKSLALGMQLSYLAGYISSFNGYSGYGSGSMELSGYRESLNRLDLSVGVKFNL